MITVLDDYTHEVGVEANFNESMYFAFHDATSGVGGFLRLANRPNEGIGERTVCLYLPDGTVGFGFERPRIEGNATLQAAGLSVEIAQPMQDVRVRFDGRVNLLADPPAMLDPKTALAQSPAVEARIVLQYIAIAPAHEQTFDADGQSFAPNHYEQLAEVTGRLEIGDTHVTVRGHGLRDHSWGPRSWQAPWFYRWLHASSGDFGFMAAYFGEPDGISRRGGFVFDNGTVHACDDVEIVTSRDTNGFQQHIELSVRAGDRHWQLSGEALSSVPLRHRGAEGRPDTRIIETAMRWSLPDGREIRGMAEYLDQIHHGEPVGAQV